MIRKNNKNLFYKSNKVILKANYSWDGNKYNHKFNKTFNMEQILPINLYLSWVHNIKKTNTPKCSEI